LRLALVILVKLIVMYGFAVRYNVCGKIMDFGTFQFHAPIQALQRRRENGE
jgi:hypothetical protein